MPRGVYAGNHSVSGSIYREIEIENENQSGHLLAFRRQIWHARELDEYINANEIATTLQATNIYNSNEAMKIYESSTHSSSL